MEIFGSSQLFEVKGGAQLSPNNRIRSTNIPQIIAEAKGLAAKTKKGPSYYNSGPELLSSLKGPQTAVVRKEGNTRIALDDTRCDASLIFFMNNSPRSLLRLNALRNQVVNKIVDKSSGLK